MRWLGNLLLVYCCLAVVVSAWVGVLQCRAMQRAANERDSAGIALKQAESTANDLRNAWLELDNEQRANRAQYSGAEAVDVGYRAQQAFETYQLADRQLVQAGQQYDLLDLRAKTTAQNLIPLAISLLLHGLGIAFFWPRGSFKQPGRSRPDRRIY